MFNFIESEELEKNITKEYIDTLEKEMKIKFPNILKEFYLKHNYSKIKECSFKIDNIDDDFSLDIIIPLKYGTTPLESEYKWVLNNKEISNNYIPLACDMDGDNYYWDSQDEKVYYVSTENVNNPILICNSVAEFFEILNKCSDKLITIPNINYTKYKKNNSFEKKQNRKDMIITIAVFLVIISAIVYYIIK